MHMITIRKKFDVTNFRMYMYNEVNTYQVKKDIFLIIFKTAKFLCTFLGTMFAHPDCRSS